MIRITHPRPELGRQSALGVEFRDGVATVDGLHPERELALKQHGFTVTVVEEPAPKRSKRPGKGKPAEPEIVAEATVEPLPDGGFGPLPEVDPAAYDPDAVDLEE